MEAANHLHRQKLIILSIILLLMGCNTKSSIEFENEIEIISLDNSTSQLDFSHTGSLDDWNEIIVYRPFARPEPAKDYKLNLFSKISDINNDDSHYICAFLLDDNYRYYMRIPRKYNLDTLLEEDEYISLSRSKEKFIIQINDEGEVMVM